MLCNKYKKWTLKTSRLLQFKKSHGNEVTVAILRELLLLMQKSLHIL
jgi:hypothetical protein